MADELQLRDSRAGTPVFNPAEMGALSHLYRGELYRSKVWRNRLDTTTNWAVATTGLAVSVAFSSPTNSPIPLILIALLDLVFLGIEARRYRYFDIWRTRVRLMEVFLFGPILKGLPINFENGWNRILADDYEHLGFHIGFLEAFGRRLRRNYIWIFLILGITYFAKILIHPTAAESWTDLQQRAAIGHLSGTLVFVFLALFYLVIFTAAVVSSRQHEAAGRITDLDDHNDPMLKFGIRI